MVDQHYNTPSSAKTSTGNNGFGFQPIENGNHVFIQTHKKQKLIDSFKVLCIVRLKIAISNKEFKKVIFGRQH
jgi:hypothetical protein